MGVGSTSWCTTRCHPRARPGPYRRSTTTPIAAQIATSTTATFHCAQASFDQLVAHHGTLVILTSPAGIEGSGNLPLYGCVKGAQRGILKSLAREWGPHGVRVNAIAPVARTPAMDIATAANPTLEARLVGRTPLGRIGDSTTDIGPVAVFPRLRSRPPHDRPDPGRRRRPLPGALVTEVHLLVGPDAGRGRAGGARATVVEVLKSEGADVVDLTGADPAASARAAADAVAAGAGRLIVVGGDGLVHLGLQAVAGTSTVLGVVPVGTGNDFARGLDGIEAESADAARAALGDAVALDAIRAGDHWVASVATAGFSADVNERANKMGFPPRGVALHHRDDPRAPPAPDP